MVKDYMKYYKKYKQLYGENTAILYQNGSFFEIFDPEPTSIYADTLCNLLNIMCSRKNKAIIDISYQNPRFGGFTIHSLEKYLRVLQASNWTTVLIEQTTSPPRPKREVTQIISPGTYIDNCTTVQSNFVFSLYVEKLKQYKTNINLNYIGLSAIDVSTGKIYVYETADTLTDQNLAAHEAYRFIHSYNSNPQEVIVNFTNGKDNQFLDMLCLKNIYVNQWFNSFMNKVSYQNKIFEKYYKSEILSPIEMIGLEKHEHARISLCILFQYIYEHNPRLLNRIDVPKYWELNDHLLLSHNSYEQLNLYSNDKSMSVYDVLNQTSTSMGSRLLHDKLLHPIANTSILNKHYDMIEFYSDKTDILTKLKPIVDLERFHRKLLLGKLHPMEFVKLIQSYEIIKDIAKNDNEDIYQLLDKKIKDYEKLFCFVKMSQCKFDQMNKNFFQENVYPEIDKLERSKQQNLDNLENIRVTMINKYIKIDNKTNESELVKLVKTDKEGYYISMTKLRWQKISKFFTFDTRIMSSYVKLSNKEIKDINDNLDEISHEMSIKLLECYLNFCETVNSQELHKIHDYVAVLDVYLSSAKVANIYGYHRPKLVENTESWVDVKDMRHPLVERINTYEDYVPNDLCLGKDKTGMIITGCNAVGKSTLLRALGVNIVMAQAGMFVPCSSMELSLFKVILTRIEGNDDILRGKSSFIVEMMELKNILERSNNNSIVLADEVCRGTESNSGIAILSSCIIELMNNKIPFMFSTHLHKIKEINEIKMYDNLEFFYLQMDILQDKIIINRKLKKGFCPEHYGIEVAKFILKNDKFISRAFKIRNQLLGEHNQIVACKVSRYNKDIYMDRCEWKGCNETKQLHTHHIKHQKNADSNGLNDGYIYKNQESNLMVLCEKHHKIIHMDTC